MPYFTTEPTKLEGYGDPVERTEPVLATGPVEMNLLKNAQIEAWKAQTEYACEYMHHGKKWCASFFAVDDADAVVKLESIKQSLVILGPIECTIPYTP